MLCEKFTQNSRAARFYFKLFYFNLYGYYLGSSVVVLVACGLNCDLNSNGLALL